MFWKYTIALLITSVTAHAAVQTISPKDTVATPMPPPSTGGIAMQSYMHISPAQRAQDFQQAFEQLRKEKTAGKVYFQLADGTTISNVIDMNLMSNSTLVMFRFNSSQGVRFQVVKVEDILNIYY